jgi:hypothetical protein
MVKNKLKSMVVGGMAAVLAIGPTVAIAKTDNGNSNAGNKITICHATGSQTNPFVRITPNANGVVNGHIGHQDARDIIPPFSYNDHGTTKQFAGQNWDANGQAIFNNGCKVTEGGGPTADCDGDFDNSPASECPTAGPTADCDGDFDNSPASECPTGGQGGGQVLGSTTSSRQGAATTQVVTPRGGVNAGSGGANAFSLTTLQRVW